MKAVVTGCSRGLGLALSNQLVEAGWQVLGLSRSAGSRVDLSDPDAVVAWLETGELQNFLADAHQILLINNAGTVSPSVPVGNQAVREIIAAVQLNVSAALVLSDAVLRLRDPNAATRIVHISSGAARHPYPGWSVYCATKAALDMHAQALAIEGHPNLRVGAVAPGIVDTEMQSEIRQSEGFPLRDRFVEYKDQGQLVAPDLAASRIISLIDSVDFGTRVVTDIRD